MRKSHWLVKAAYCDEFFFQKHSGTPAVIPKQVSTCRLVMLVLIKPIFFSLFIVITVTIYCIFWLGLELIALVDQLFTKMKVVNGIDRLCIKLSGVKRRVCKNIDIE